MPNKPTATPARSLRPLPATYATSRENLHRLAVYVVSPARRQHNPRAVALSPTEGGFGTAPYGPDGTVLRVEGAMLVLERAGERLRTPITSLNAAAALAGIEPDLAQQDAFDVPPHGDPNAPLAIDAEATHRLGDWYALAYELLEELRSTADPDDAPTAIRIWPEHFDAAIELGPDGARGTYGASPGDRHHTTPYLYATALAGTMDDPFWNAEGFDGAWLPYEQLAGSADPVVAGREFFQSAREHVRGS